MHEWSRTTSCCAPTPCIRPPDLHGFVRALVAAALREVYLVMRLPTSDGVMAEASRIVWGHPHDSPNLVVAYNALLEMGIYPDIVVQRELWRPWVSESLEAALIDVKRRLGVSEISSFDAPLARPAQPAAGRHGRSVRLARRVSDRRCCGGGSRADLRSLVRMV